MTDYENDDKKELDITSPGGAETKIEPAEASCCGAYCAFINDQRVLCNGPVLYRETHIHLCSTHAKELSNWGGEYEDNSDPVKLDEHHGGWYNSEPSDKETESID